MDPEEQRRQKEREKKQKQRARKRERELAIVPAGDAGSQNSDAGEQGVFQDNTQGVRRACSCVSSVCRVTRGLHSDPVMQVRCKGGLFADHTCNKQVPEASPDVPCRTCKTLFTRQVDNLQRFLQKQEFLVLAVSPFLLDFRQFHGCNGASAEDVRWQNISQDTFLVPQELTERVVTLKEAVVDKPGGILNTSQDSYKILRYFVPDLAVGSKQSLHERPASYTQLRQFAAALEEEKFADCRRLCSMEPDAKAVKSLTLSANQLESFYKKLKSGSPTPHIAPWVRDGRCAQSWLDEALRDACFIKPSFDENYPNSTHHRKVAEMPNSGNDGKDMLKKQQAADVEEMLKGFYGDWANWQLRFLPSGAPKLELRAYLAISPFYFDLRPFGGKQKVWSPRLACVRSGCIIVASND